MKGGERAGGKERGGKKVRERVVKRALLVVIVFRRYSLRFLFLFSLLLTISGVFTRPPVEADAARAAGVHCLGDLFEEEREGERARPFFLADLIALAIKIKTCSQSPPPRAPARRPSPSPRPPRPLPSRCETGSLQ